MNRHSACRAATEPCPQLGRKSSSGGGAVCGGVSLAGCSPGEFVNCQRATFELAIFDRFVSAGKPRNCRTHRGVLVRWRTGVEGVGAANDSDRVSRSFGDSSRAPSLCEAGHDREAAQQQSLDAVVRRNPDTRRQSGHSGSQPGTTRLGKTNDAGAARREERIAVGHLQLRQSLPPGGLRL